MCSLSENLHMYKIFYTDFQMFVSLQILLNKDDSNYNNLSFNITVYAVSFITVRKSLIYLHISI